MNDEACVLYDATIDQMTEGHRFLMENFNVRPRIGWQIGTRTCTTCASILRRSSTRT